MSKCVFVTKNSATEEMSPLFLILMLWKQFSLQMAWLQKSQMEIKVGKAGEGFQAFPYSSSPSLSGVRLFLL